MNYPFECPKCGHEESVTMKITEYKPDGHMCPECGTEMQRTIASMAGAMSIDNTGTFYRRVN